MKVLPSAPVHSTAPEWGSFRASIGGTRRLRQTGPDAAACQFPGGQREAAAGARLPAPAGLSLLRGSSRLLG